MECSFLSVVARSFFYDLTITVGSFSDYVAIAVFLHERTILDPVLVGAFEAQTILVFFYTGSILETILEGALELKS